jgi:hypothetical protein
MHRATALLLAGALLVGCSATPQSDNPSGSRSSGTAPGCDMVQRSKVVGLLGEGSVAKATGSVAALRDERTRATCRTTVPGHPERYVSVVADYHPAPFRLPSRGCSEGWVYAGTPDKYTPACQDTVQGHGRTQLFVRWQPYLMHVTIGRSDKDWGGDPEAALAMSRALAQKLGVAEAEGDG